MDETTKPIIVKKRRYTGPQKGSDEAKARMAKVRAAQWAKNGLVVSNPNAARPPPERVETISQLHRKSVN